MATSVSVAYPHEPVADWELWLTASAQQHRRVSYWYHQLRKGSDVKVQFLLRVYHFHTTMKSKNCKLKRRKLGAIYVKH